MAGFAHGRARELERRNPGAALAETERSIELAPRNAHFYASAGDLAVHLGRFDEAIQHYRSAIGCDPYRASYHWRLARVLATAGNRDDEVVEQLRLANALNPTKQLYREDLERAEESVRQSARALLESSPTTQRELDSSAATQ